MLVTMVMKTLASVEGTLTIKVLGNRCLQLDLVAPTATIKVLTYPDSITVVESGEQPNSTSFSIEGVYKDSSLKEHLDTLGMPKFLKRNVKAQFIYKLVDLVARGYITELSLDNVEGASTVKVKGVNRRHFNVTVSSIMYCCSRCVNVHIVDVAKDLHIESKERDGTQILSTFKKWLRR